MSGNRKLGRPTEHRMAMLRALVTYLLEKGSIETTLYRAKEVKSLADKMITLGKNNTLASKRRAMTFITNESVVKKLFDEIAPKYADRNGGYTTIVKLGPRRGDGAEMALIELVGNREARLAAKNKKAAKKVEEKKTEEKPEEKTEQAE